MIAELQAKLGDDKVAFHTGISYRHLVKIKDAAWMKAKCVPPHDIAGQPVASHLPTGKGSEVVRDLMDRSQAILGNHKINQVRRDLGENPATSIWLWGQGGSPRLPSFRERFGVQGTVIAAVDLIRGIAACVGWKLVEVEGATGYLDTNYHGKGEAAVKALDETDFVAVHVEAPDEAGHNGDAPAQNQGPSNGWTSTSSGRCWRSSAPSTHGGSCASPTIRRPSG